MRIDEAVRRILALGASPVRNDQPAPDIGARIASFLGESYAPGATAMGKAFAPGQGLRDNPVGAATDLNRSYQDMRRTNVIGADKYFHCKGNCEAAQRGAVSAWTAEHLSNAREALQLRLRTEGLSDALQDQEANQYGRAAGRMNPGGTCSGLCSNYRVRGIPPGY